MTAFEVANALTARGNIFCRRRWVVVPNVSWGWDLRYEADLIAVSKNNWADEIEIKVSKADLLADAEKDKFTRVRGYGLDDRIKRFWYAVPAELVDTALRLSKEYGVIKAYRGGDGPGGAAVIRRAKLRDGARQVTPEELQKLLHLGVMRYWDLRFRKAQP